MDYQSPCIYHFIFDIVAMTDMRAKRLTEQGEKALAGSRRETEQDMAIEELCEVEEGRSQLSSLPRTFAPNGASAIHFVLRLR